MARLEYLFAAYTVIWVLMFLYVRVLARRNQRLEQELEELRARLGTGEPRGGATPRAAEESESAG